MIIIILLIYALFSTFALILSRKRSNKDERRFIDEISELKRRHLYDDLASSISNSFVEYEETGVLIQNTLLMTAMSLGAGRASLARVDTANNTISFDYSYSDPKQNLARPQNKHMAFTSGNIFYDSFIVRGDVSVIYKGFSKDYDLEKNLGLPGLKACIYIPINMYGEFWGAMGIEHYIDHNAWNDGDAKILKHAVSAMRTLLLKSDAEKTLIAAMEKAESLSFSKTNFLSGISRELRAPINEIISMADIIKNSQDSSLIEYCLTKIYDTSSHILRITGDIHDMSKIETGNFKLSVLEFDFKKCLDRIVEIVKFKINEKHINLEVKFERLLPNKVIADERRFLQAFANLLLSVCAVTPVNGKVDFYVSAVNSDNSYTVRFCIIAETEINEEEKKRFFSSYEHIDSEHIDSSSALGLVVSKKIIDLMGGKIWYETKNKNQFVISVEMSFIEEKIHADKQPVIEADDEYELDNIFAGKHILVAEDIKINRDILSQILEGTGVSIDFAENGKTALKLFDENSEKYGLILTDIHMPEMDGYEAVRRIRELKKGMKIPIIAMTANIFEKDINKCFAVGMNDHIGKPLKVPELIKKLKKHLNQNEVNRKPLS